MDRKKRGALAGVGVGLGLGIALAPFIGPFALLLPPMSSIVGGKIAGDTEPEPKRNRHDEHDIDEDDPIYHGIINRRPQPMNFLYADVLKQLEDSLNDNLHHTPVIPYIPLKWERQEHENPAIVSNYKPAKKNNTSNRLPDARGSMENDSYFRRHGR